MAHPDLGVNQPHPVSKHKLPAAVYRKRARCKRVTYTPPIPAIVRACYGAPVLNRWPAKAENLPQFPNTPPDEW